MPRIVGKGVPEGSASTWEVFIQGEALRWPRKENGAEKVLKRGALRSYPGSLRTEALRLGLAGRLATAALFQSEALRSGTLKGERFICGRLERAKRFGLAPARSKPKRFGRESSDRE